MQLDLLPSKHAWDSTGRRSTPTLFAFGCFPFISHSSAIDKKTGEKIAIKKLCRPFQSEIFAKRAYRELTLLKHMQHENVSNSFLLFPCT